MIGVFDSGLGWLLTAKYLQQQLPQYEYLYLWDLAYVPWGERSGERIQERTFVCLEWLFSQGCELVILACNTASAYAIRPWQEQHPNKKVLSITIPGVEQAHAKDYQNCLLFATRATITSHIYPSVCHKLGYEMSFIPCIGTGLVDLIETATTPEHIKNSLQELLPLGSQFDACILWCTHYPLIADLIQELLPDIPLIDPAYEAVQRLPAYLKRHPEITEKLSTTPWLHVALTSMGNFKKASNYRGLPQGDDLTLVEI